MQSPYKLISVQFQSDCDSVERGKNYTYYVPKDTPVEVDDYAVAIVAGKPRMTKVTKIMGHSQSARESAHRIIFRVLTKHELGTFDFMQGDLERYMEIRSRLQALKDEQDEMEVWRQLALRNPEAKDLMNQLDQIGQLAAPVESE